MEAAALLDEQRVSRVMADPPVQASGVQHTRTLTCVYFR